MIELKAVSLFSGGIDSPVATFLAAKELEVKSLYFDNSPYVGKENIERAVNVFKKIQERTKVNGLVKMNHGPNLKEIHENCEDKHLCVLCKRMMLRAGSRFAEKTGAGFLVTGSNLAQVASQTLQNIETENDVSSIPILRPLIGLEKNEIIRIARDIGTFEASTVPSVGCEVLPSKPSTRTMLEEAREEEKKLDVDKMVDRAVGSAETLF